MVVSRSLAAKGLGGLAVAATTGYLGYNYRSEIASIFSGRDNIASLNEKIKKLGIEGCELENLKSPKTCTLNKAKLEKINFSNKEGTTNVTVSSDASLNLKIEKSAEATFKDGLKFTLTNSNDSNVEIKKNERDTDTKIIFKKDADYEFKISDDNKLEKAWTIKSLGERTGLFTCVEPAANANTNECTLKEEINVWKNETDYITGGKTPAEETNRKITFAKDSGSYFEGFKFTVGGDINLTEGTKKNESGGVNKLTNNNMSYELGIKNTDNGKKWFFIEKAAS